ncbi:hypothetical protein BASA81_012697 [Batrachochytrium salamandrivorans]|nr:hypothetical protein BASA81_012697 [Batrachochytrium salamandrivorans]
MFLANLVPGVCWTLGTEFRVFGLFEANNNGLIVKAKLEDDTHLLVAVNCPKLNAQSIGEIQGLEREENCKLLWVVGTDWHHLFAQQWAQSFPAATVVFPSHRAVRKHDKDHFTALVLDRNRPVLPRVSQDSLRLVPVLGFKGPPSPALCCGSRHADEVFRSEYAVYLPAIKLLFIFDLLLPSMPSKTFGFPPVPEPVTPPLPSSNFSSKWLSGFRVEDHALCSATAKSLLDLDVDMLVFAHGDLAWGAVLQDRTRIKAALGLLKPLLI